jgi:hypothetical protein
MKKGFYLQSLLIFCFILSSVAVKAAPALVITANPLNTTICAGDTTYFSVTVIDTPGTPTIYYKWQVSTDGGGTWSTIKDTLEYFHTSTDTLRLAADNSLNGNMYRSIDSSVDGVDTSLAAILTVRHPSAGTIMGANAVCKSGTITLSSTVAGGVWQSMNNTYATVGSTSGIVTGVKQGYDTIKYSLDNGCGPDTVWTVIRIDTVVTALAITGPTTLCKGSVPVNLVNGNNLFGTWVWSASNANASVSSSGVTYGIAGGTSIISYVFTNGCNSVTSTITVTIDTVLPHGVITGADSVCAGSWIHLNESISGGVWITSSGAIAVVDGLGNVTGVGQGSSIISYFFTNGCGPSVATHPVKVNRTAAAIGGIDSVGIGLTRVLTDSTTGGWWMSSDTSIASIDTFSGLVTGKDTGITIISYTVTNLCGITISTLTLNVGPAPTVSGIYGTAGGFDSSVCIGGTIALFDSTVGGIGRWSSSRDTIASVDSITGVVTGLKTDFSNKLDTVNVGIDTIYYTFTNAFGTTTVNIPIVVNQAPVVRVSGPSIIVPGTDYFFKGTPYYGWNHTPNSIFAPNLVDSAHLGAWTDSNSAMGTIIAIIDSNFQTSVASYVVMNSGKDRLTYTIQNGCGTSHADFRIALTLSVKQPTNDLSALKVFPNPTEGAITVKIASDINEEVHVAITNVLGEKVKELTISTNKAYDIQLDQPAGMYLISATGVSGSCSAKIVVGK